MHFMNARALSAPLIALGLALTAPGASLAVGLETAAPTTGYSAAQAAVDAGRYRDAMGILADLARSDPQNADVWNLLGFSSRKLGNTTKAAEYYAYALQLNPRHLGALEYQGELFVETGQITKAKANLDMLARLCGTSCEAYQDLAAMIQGAGQS